MAPVLGYWDIRGLAQSIRFLLEYTGTEYEEKVYRVGEAPDYDKSSWLSVKENLGLDFPNLPYYFDGDTKLTQSNAILRYIARKHDLCGMTEEEKVRVDMLENHAADIRNAWTRICYGDFDTGIGAYLEAMAKAVKQYSDFLGTRPWFAGDNISFVDFVVYELLYEHLQLEKDLLKDAKNLQKFQKRFEELEPIKKYMASPRFIKSPINNKMAKFGSK